MMEEYNKLRATKSLSGTPISYSEIRPALLTPNERTAIKIGASFSEETVFLEGVRRLLHPSDGVDHNQLQFDTDMFAMGSKRSFHLSYEPLLALEKRIYSAIDRRRHAYALRAVWQSGKVGHPILPRPDDVRDDEYNLMTSMLLAQLTAYGTVNPEEILDDLYGQDLSFYLSLPDQFTVYRGANGISPQQCAAGLCWATKREIANWYSNRFSPSRDPVLVSARVRKCEIATVFAEECEVVVRPKQFRKLLVDLNSPRHFPVGSEWSANQVPLLCKQSE